MGGKEGGGDWIGDVLDRPCGPREVHPASLAEAEFVAQCVFGKDRSGGPGGQHRNKVETRVTVTHTPTGLSGQASERRSAIENRSVAIRRLRLVLAVEHRSLVPTGECRSEMWRERTRGGRIACNERHWDFPAMLAEAMDVLAACGQEPRKAAVRLCVSASQLNKLLRVHAPAWERLNAERAARGLHALK